jgi:hypothetical protein
MQRLLLVQAICTYVMNQPGNQEGGQGQNFWVYPRSGHFWQEVINNAWQLDVIHRVTCDNYQHYFGMEMRLFEILVTKIARHMPPRSGWILARDRIEFKLAVGFVLFRLATGAGLKIISSKFGVGKSTVVKYTKVICKILATKVYGEYIGIPKGKRLQKIIKGFESASTLPMVMGALDGTHIILAKKPNKDQYPADYWCRTWFHSVVMQGICNHKQSLWSTSCLIPGSQHDSTHFWNSSIWLRMHDEDLWTDAPQLQLEGTTIRPCLLADSAYPLRSWLLKRYFVHAGHDMEKNEFDAAHSQGRVLIENSFAHLKSKWQICQSINVDLFDIPMVVISSAVLHNFVKMKGFPLEPGNYIPAGIPLRRSTTRSSRLSSLRVQQLYFDNWLATRSVTSSSDG